MLHGVARDKNRSETVGITFHTSRSKHEVREHYRIYDNNSFIADFGGFMGLLLGHSLFGIYCMGEEYIFKWLAKLGQGSKNPDMSLIGRTENVKANKTSLHSVTSHA